MNKPIVLISVLVIGVWICLIVDSHLPFRKMPEVKALSDNGKFAVSVMVPCKGQPALGWELSANLEPILLPLGFKSARSLYAYHPVATFLGDGKVLPSYLTVTATNNSLIVTTKGDLNANGYTGHSDALAFQVAEELVRRYGNRSTGLTSH